MANEVNSNDELLSKLTKFYDDFIDSVEGNQKLSKRDRRYYDGDQWEKEDRATMEAASRPVITNNRVRPKVNYLSGSEIQGRTDPKAFARTPDHEADADSITDALRFVWDKEDGDEVRTQATMNQLVEGIGAAEVVGEEINGQIEVKINCIPYETFFYDPYSRRADFQDARYLGIAPWMDKNLAKELYPEAKERIDEAVESTDNDLQDDRPNTNWVTTDRQRIKVLQIYWLNDGEWWHAKLVRSGFLEEPAVSPYVDEFNKAVCPIEGFSGYIDQENGRHGVVRDMISPQDQINHVTSKAVHLINVRQVRVDTATMSDANAVETIRGELAKPDGVIDARDGDFEVLQTGDMAIGQFNLLQEAKLEMSQQGPNAANVGKGDQGQSGRAILAQQQGGMLEHIPLVDKRRNWDRRLYEQIWNRIRQYWTEERWIRVTDDERNVRFVGINRSVPRSEAMTEEVAQLPEEQQAQGIEMIQQLIQEQPAFMAQEVKIDNEVSFVDVDIILEEGQDVVTIQAEESESLRNLAASGYPVPPEMIVETSQLTRAKKDKMLKEMEEPNPQAQEAAMLEMQQKQAETEKLLAEVQETLSKVDLNNANAQKAIVDSNVSAFGAANQ